MRSEPEFPHGLTHDEWEQAMHDVLDRVGGSPTQFLR